MAIDREEIRAWLEANCPPEMREPGWSDEDIAGAGGAGCFSPRRRSVWLERCISRGPHRADMAASEYGGAGYSRDEAKVLKRKWTASMRARRWSASASGCSAPPC